MKILSRLFRWWVVTRDVDLTRTPPPYSPENAREAWVTVFFPPQWGWKLCRPDMHRHFRDHSNVEWVGSGPTENGQLYMTGVLHH